MLDSWLSVYSDRTSISVRWDEDMREIGLVLLLCFFAASHGSAQGLDPANPSGSKSYLLKTYPNECKIVKSDVVDSVDCSYKDYAGTKFFNYGAGSAFINGRKDWADIVSISILPLSATNDPDFQKRFFYLTRQIPFAGSVLAEKYPTIQSLVDFCRSRPDADRHNAGCILEETDEPGVKEGLRIMYSEDTDFILMVIKNKR
jgi:hypothetical protein